MKVRLSRLVSRNSFHKIIVTVVSLISICSYLGYQSGLQLENIQENAVPPCVICPPIPPNLPTKLHIVKSIFLEEVENRFKDSVAHGGSYYPVNCLPRWKVAIIVPYRNRDHQVAPFLNHMHSFLQLQQLNYTIYIVHQADSKRFNRAKLLNVGFTEAEKDGSYDCYVFHDVDLLPENAEHLYHCSPMPRHLNVAASNTDYKEMYRVKYSMYFGGINMLTSKHFKLVNGFSNKYWGWGGEDDDMRVRIAIKKLHVWRYPKEIARYSMLEHKPPDVNERRYEDLRENIQNTSTDGLNSLNYSLRSFERKKLYTHLLVDL